MAEHIRQSVAPAEAEAAKGAAGAARHEALEQRSRGEIEYRQLLGQRSGGPKPRQPAAAPSPSGERLPSGPTASAVGAIVQRQPVIQLKLDPVSEMKLEAIKAGEAAARGELARQEAALGTADKSLQLAAATLDKIDLTKLDLAMGRVNRAIEILNGNIDAKKVADVGGGAAAAAAAAAAARPKVAMAEVVANPLFHHPLVERLLENPDVVHWMDREKPLPDNVRGVIAEEHAALMLSEGLATTEGALVLSDLKVVKPSANPAYRWTDVKQIDVLTVFMGPGGWIPVDLMEVKAGLQGARVEATKNEARAKVKALVDARKNGHSILRAGVDITKKFDWGGIAEGGVSASTGGVGAGHDIALDEGLMANVLRFLNDYHAGLHGDG